MDLFDIKNTLLKHSQNCLKKPTISVVGSLQPATYFACSFISQDFCHALEHLFTGSSMSVCYSFFSSPQCQTRILNFFLFLFVKKSWRLQCRTQMYFFTIELVYGLKNLAQFFQNQVCKKYLTQDCKMDFKPIQIL